MLAFCAPCTRTTVNVGTAIFLASVVLGTIYLFGITKDRWKWPTIVKRLAIGGVALLVIATAAFLGWGQLHQWRLRLAQREESAARTCIAGDLPRMEKLLQTIQSSVHEDMKLNDVKATVDRSAAASGSIIPAKDDIKESVLIYELPTHCASRFRFTANVRADEQGTVRWLRVWAQHAPEGYGAGPHPELSTDFDQIRLERAQEQQQRAAQTTEAESRIASQLVEEAQTRRVASQRQHLRVTITSNSLTRAATSFISVGEQRMTNLAALGYRHTARYAGSLIRGPIFIGGKSRAFLQSRQPTARYC